MSSIAHVSSTRARAIKGKIITLLRHVFVGGQRHTKVSALSRSGSILLESVLTALSATSGRNPLAGERFTHRRRKSRARCVGRGCPPPGDGLSALVDLGISDEQLAFYFRVELQRVKRYRKKSGIGPNSDASLRFEFGGAEPLAVSACPALQPETRIDNAIIPMRPAAQYDRNSF